MEFIESLKKITYENVEIIVVDNASDVADDIDCIARKYPDVKLVKSDQNLGFAGGNNLGIRVATGNAYLFVNNDVEFEPDFLQPLVDTLYTKPEAGMVSPKIHFYHSHKTIQYAGCDRIDSLTTRGHFIGHGVKDQGQFDEERETSYAHGAAMLVKREVVEQAGVMPELYFLFYEELDWCNRIREAGYKIYYQPKSLVHHKESMSVGKKSPLKTYYMTRSRMIFLKRNTSGIVYLLGMLYFLLLAIPKNILVHIIRGEQQLMNAYFRGVGAFFNHTRLA